MDIGILVAICILAVELIIILIVVGYIMTVARKRKENKRRRAAEKEKEEKEAQQRKEEEADTPTFPNMASEHLEKPPETCSVIKEVEVIPPPPPVHKKLATKSEVSTPQPPPLEVGVSSVNVNDDDVMAFYENIPLPDEVAKNVAAAENKEENKTNNISTQCEIVVSGNTGETNGKTDETSGNTGETNGKTDETSGNTDETNGKTDETSGNTGEASGNTDETSGNTGETSGNTGEVSGNTDELPPPPLDATEEHIADNDDGDVIEAGDVIDKTSVAVDDVTNGEEIKIESVKHEDEIENNKQDSNAKNKTLSLKIESNADSNSLTLIRSNGSETKHEKISSKSESVTDPQRFGGVQLPIMTPAVAPPKDDFEIVRRIEHVPNVTRQIQLSNLTQEPQNLDRTEQIAREKETAVAGIVNVTTGEKLDVCRATRKGLIPKRTALLLLEAQAATGCVVNPKNGVRMSVLDAVECGLVDLSFKQGLIAAEGAYYGYMDPRTEEQITLNEAIRRGIFPRPHGTRLLEFQVATGGVIDPWTGLRYPLEAAVHRGLIDADLAVELNEETNFFDANAQTHLGYADLLSKCVRDLDTGLRLLYIEEKSAAVHDRYQPDLLTFRSAFRRKVTLQELIEAGLVEEKSLNALQRGLISKDQLRDALHPFLIGEDPISGILDRTHNKVMSVSQAVNEGLLRRNTALELLEAQAATGGIVDPLTGRRMPVQRAAKEGLVLTQFVPALERAEQAVSGYLDAVSGRTISLYEAIRKGVVIEIHGIRLLDAQFATGGLIDPVAGYRIPATVALERKLLDQRLAEILTNTRNDMGLKGYYDPNSGGNLTYSELMASCIRSRKHHSLPLLPLHHKSPVTYAFRSKPRTSHHRYNKS